MKQFARSAFLGMMFVVLMFVGTAFAADGTANETENWSNMLVAEITGENVNVRNTPNAQGKVVFRVSSTANDCLIISKIPVKDSSGQEWYKIFYRWAEDAESEENGFISVDKPAYISGKFLKMKAFSDSDRESWGLLL
ncbi:hypothetical protein FACS1894216_20000 [Synergistales bacterium]|nr:hypothetical protein FACS1894216_20000 [Synergistales bacterium]